MYHRRSILGIILKTLSGMCFLPTAGCGSQSFRMGRHSSITTLRGDLLYSLSLLSQRERTFMDCRVGDEGVVLSYPGAQPGSGRHKHPVALGLPAVCRCSGFIFPARAALMPQLPYQKLESWSVAHRSSQAKGPIGATAASRHHSHSNSGSEAHL